MFLKVVPTEQEYPQEIGYLYWIEAVKPGTFQFILYEKSKERINQYKKTKKEVDEFINDINSEYKSIKKEINKFF